MARDGVIGWLLDSDPVLRWQWQVERDLAHAPDDVWRTMVSARGCWPCRIPTASGPGPARSDPSLPAQEG